MILSLYKTRLFLFVFFTGILLLPLKGQEHPFSSENFEVNGYITDVQTIMDFEFPPPYNQFIDNEWIMSNMIHNRLNMFWYPSGRLTFSVQLRNRFIWSDLVRMDDLFNYKSSLEYQDAFYHYPYLNVLDGGAYVFNVALDRLYFQYSLGKLEITGGRQRINWSQTYVWNPNDIFNTYSFFEFDYPERQGCNALRLQYYTGIASSVELAAKYDSTEHFTIAGLWKINKWQYDFQFLAGIMDEQEYVAGLGWSGNIGGAGFKGEASYFHPKTNLEDTTGQFVTSLSFDYMFDNSVYFQFEGLYNELPDDFNKSLYGMLSNPLSAKALSISEWNLFASASYPVNPLINAGFSVILYPDLDGFFAGPSIDLSVSDNFDFSLNYQHFNYDNTITNERSRTHIAYIRFKYSF